MTSRGARRRSDERRPILRRESAPAIEVDTGPIAALLNDRDDHHERSRNFSHAIRGRCSIPSTVFTGCYLYRTPPVHFGVP
jgi:hypothetical protein